MTSAPCPRCRALVTELQELRALILSVPVRTSGGTTRFYRTDSVGAHVDAIATAQERILAAQEVAHARKP